MNDEYGNLTDEDAALMVAVTKGDDAAFEKLVVRHQKPLLNFFYRTCVNIDVEDLVQQTFVRLYRYRDRYSPTAKFTTFLYLIARQVRVDEIRRRIHIQKIRDKYSAELEVQGTYSTEVPYSGLKDDLQDALAKLSEAHRDVVVLGMLQEFPYSEVAKILDIPEGTVKSRMHHALRELRQILDPCRKK